MKKITMMALAIALSVTACQQQKPAEPEKAGADAAAATPEKGKVDDKGGEAAPAGDKAAADKAAKKEGEAAPAGDKTGEVAQPGTDAAQPGTDAAQPGTDAAQPAAVAAAAPGDVMTGPKAVTLNGVYATEKFPMRIGFAIESLVKSGLAETLMGYIPAEEKAKYDTFVTDTGFDPMQRVEGLVVLSTSPDVMGENPFRDKNNKAYILAFVKGEVDLKLIETLEALDEDDEDEEKDEDDEDDKEDSSLAGLGVFTTITPEALTKIKAELDERVATPKDGKTYQAIALDDAHLLYVKTEEDEDNLEFMYVWAGGMLMGEFDKAENMEEAAKTAANAFIGELNATPDTAPAVPFMAMTAGMGGSPMDASITVTDKVVINAKVPVPPTELPQVQGMLGQLPKFKQDPKAITAQVPPPFQGLVEFAIKGTEAKLDGNTVTASVTLPIAELTKVLPPAPAPTAEAPKAPAPKTP